MMKSNMMNTACAFILLFISSSANALYIVDTGQPVNSTYNWSIIKQTDGEHFFAVKFIINQGYALNGIQAFIRFVWPGTLTMVIYGDAGDTPDTSQELFSSSFSSQATSTPTWLGLSGLNLSLQAGTYWLGFEPRDSGNFYAVLPDNAPSPLPLTSIYDSSWGSYIPASTNHSVGVRITGNDEFPWEIFMPAIFVQKTSSPACQDSDGDGYGDPGTSTCPNSGLDCNDDDSSIYPGAPETCGDGLDQDCNGEDLACISYCSDSMPPTGEMYTYQVLNTTITFSTITQSVSEAVGGHTVYRIWGTEDPPELGLYISCDSQHGWVDVATDWWDISDPSINGKSFWEPPIFYCQYGQPVGSICDWAGTFDGSPERQVMQIVGYEQVTVPFGTFPDAMKARITSYADGSVYLDDYYWIDSDVGVLKAQDITGGSTLVLTDYKPPSGVSVFNNVLSNSVNLVRSSATVLHQILKPKRSTATTLEANVIH